MIMQEIKILAKNHRITFMPMPPVPALSDAITGFETVKTFIYAYGTTEND